MRTIELNEQEAKIIERAVNYEKLVLDSTVRTGNPITGKLSPQQKENAVNEIRAIEKLERKLKG